MACFCTLFYCDYTRRQPYTKYPKKCIAFLLNIVWINVRNIDILRRQMVEACCCCGSEQLYHFQMIVLDIPLPKPFNQDIPALLPLLLLFLLIKSPARQSQPP
jgi:hypothetical protein